MKTAYLKAPQAASPQSGTQWVPRADDSVERDGTSIRHVDLLSTSASSGFWLICGPCSSFGSGVTSARMSSGFSSTSLRKALLLFSCSLFVSDRARGHGFSIDWWWVVALDELPIGGIGTMAMKCRLSDPLRKVQIAFDTSDLYSFPACDLYLVCSCWSHFLNRAWNILFCQTNFPGSTSFIHHLSMFILILILILILIAKQYNPTPPAAYPYNYRIYVT